MLGVQTNPPTHQGSSAKCACTDSRSDQSLICERSTARVAYARRAERGFVMQRTKNVVADSAALDLYWLTEKALREEPDLTLALRTFKRDLYHFWDNSDGSLLKDPEEIEDFLDNLLDDDYVSFSDLSAGQQRLVQMIRRRYAVCIRKLERGGS
jgi:hypothetical protein